MSSKNLKSFLLICLLVFCFVSCATKQSVQKINNSTWQSKIPLSATSNEGNDIVFWANTIAQNHIEPFYLVSVDIFYDECIKSITKVDSVANDETKSKFDKEFCLFMELRRLCSLIGDSHSMIGGNEAIAKELRFFPVNISYVKGEWVLFTTVPQYKDLLGKQIVSINGIEMASVIDEIKKYISWDNNVWLNLQIANMFAFADYMKYMGFVDSEDKMILEAIDGSKVSVSIMDYTEMQNSLISVKSVEPVTGRNGSYYRMFDPLPGIIFIQYNICGDYESYSVADFSKDCEAAIERVKPSKVIIDMRYNSGGNSRLFEPFIDWLALEQKEQNFKVYVLVGPGTFSSGILNSAYLKKNVDCVLVGTATGGSYNHYGEVINFNLPNSGIYASYSIKHFVIDSKYAKGSFIPDIVIEPSLSDYKNGTDNQFEWCVNN